MMEIKIDVKDTLGPWFKTLERDVEDKILMKSIKNVAYRYRAIVRKNYLSGQILGKRKGDVFNSIKVTVKKASNTAFIRSTAILQNIYDYAPGATIRPKYKKILKFVLPDGSTIFAKEVHLRPRPYMAISSAAYPFNSDLKSEADKQIWLYMQKELQRE
jgi:hypothetical protein